MFAARALKNAIFGESDRQEDETRDQAGMDSDADAGRTPTRPTPAGILLTPGTGTSRPKRVSFGNDVLEKGSKNAGTKTGGRGGRDSTRRRTRLTELLESSRQKKATLAEKKQPIPEPEKEDCEDDEWEEDDEDDASDDDDEDCCNHDITVDLNEPHSRSGKYWKSSFETYHSDAKTEMEKLLKYKQLAKSYAKMKDAEAIDLNEKLREEQEKVAEMEKRLGDMAAQIATKRLRGGERETPELMRNLAKQTALAVQYRSQVRELESLLKSIKDDGKQSRSSAAQSQVQRVLAQTQEELKQALADLDDRQKELVRVKAQLNKESNAGQRATQGHGDESAYVRDLLSQLRDAKAESRSKDAELTRLKKEFELFQQEVVTEKEESNRVLSKAMTKISELKRELRNAKTSKPEQSTRPRSFHATTTTEDAKRNSLEVKPDLHLDLQDLARLTNSTSPPPETSGRASNNLLGDVDGRRVRTTQPSRGLRDKFLQEPDEYRVDLKAEPSRRNILADQVNLGRPKWKEYVPRSPRNRAYLRDMERRSGTGADVAGAEGREEDGVEGARRARLQLITLDSDKEEDDDEDQPKLDTLKERFKNLSRPDAADIAAPVATESSRRILTTDRRAAAQARIERRKADRRLAIAGTLRSLDKENVRPNIGKRAYEPTRAGL